MSAWRVLIRRGIPSDKISPPRRRRLRRHRRRRRRRSRVVGHRGKRDWRHNVVFRARVTARSLLLMSDYQSLEIISRSSRARP